MTKTKLKPDPVTVAGKIEYLLKRGFADLRRQGTKESIWRIEQSFHWSVSSGIDYLFRDDMRIDSRQALTTVLEYRMAHELAWSVIWDNGHTPPA